MRDGRPRRALRLLADDTTGALNAAGGYVSAATTGSRASGAASAIPTKLHSHSLNLY